MLLPFLKENCIETGCDEAGRGCLAGPVFAAAVILPENISIPSLNDSKQCSEKLRLRLRDVIEKEALYFSVVAVSPEEIDQINILNASIEGMHRAIEALGINPEHIIVDGNKFKPYTETIICGNSLKSTPNTDGKRIVDIRQKSIGRLS